MTQGTTEAILYVSQWCIARDSFPYRPRHLVEERKGVRCSPNGRHKTSRSACSISLITIHATLIECSKRSISQWRPPPGPSMNCCCGPD
jgi:hypothetical protein